MVALIRTRELAFSFSKLHDLLVEYEHYLRYLDGSTSILVVIANSSQKKSSNGHSNKGKNKAKPIFQPKSSFKKSPTICQFCDQPGHTAKT